MQKTNKILVYLLTLALFLPLLQACKTWSKAAKGGVIGGVVGGTLGGLVSKKNKGVAIAAGAAIGGAAGAAIGAYMDKQAKELEQQLEKDATVVRVEEGIQVTFNGGILFDTNSDRLRPAAQQNLREFSATLRKYADTNLIIQGHTDSTGSDEYNQTLSEKRASSVQSFLLANGVGAARLDMVGMGETMPIADNNTEAGRQQNRRVEIIIVANEELKRKAENGELK
ncbi:OmpA family protein [Hugenholtzia roseola]|uniref:OmpA family protein n=1 Tax=Hugenholtzia roseola TaxID=1002 RepID=UPI0004050F54|nr:OmpA family protein [Hugenholtzia roseola]